MLANTKLSSFADNLSGFLDNTSDLVFIKDPESAFVATSRGLCDLIKMNKKNIIGATDDKLPWHDFMDFYRKCDCEVIHGKPMRIMEPLPINNHTTLTVNGFKQPILSETQEIIGIFGTIAILEVNNPWGTLIARTTKADRKNTALSGQTPIAYKIEHYDSILKLTHREAECLFLTIRGKSAKEIGRCLNISYRTVEEHLSKIKEKLGVSSRSELIANAIDRGLLEIIPKGEMLTQLCQALEE